MALVWNIDFKMEKEKHRKQTLTESGEQFGHNDIL